MAVPQRKRNFLPGTVLLCGQKFPLLCYPYCRYEFHIEKETDMNPRHTLILTNIAAFAALFTVSLYRQISLRFLPGDPVRTYIVYATYVILLATWAGFIALHITQRSMRRYLLAQAVIMLLAMTVRFVQDTFLYTSVPLMRESGLIAAATVLPVMVAGIYAALGLGQADDYKMPGYWWLLSVPVGILTALIVTDDREHFIFYIDRTENQPNLAFHPYVGMYVLSLSVLFLVVLKTWIIYRRNRFALDPVLNKMIPFIQPALLIIFLSPYILNSMTGTPEVIEFFAKLYAIEIGTWEIYIYCGLVPVNMSYVEIFENSGIPMQLCDRADRKILDSGQIPDLSGEIYEKLRSGNTVLLEDGGELHMYPLGKADFVWEKDTVRLHTIIHKLEQTASELEDEGILLDEEVRAKSERAKTDAQNKIYDRLTAETAFQLELMKKIIKRMEREGSDRNGFRQLMLLGTYVKRRCNLRLIERDTGTITDEDLRICFQDMARRLERQGVKVRILWNASEQFSPDYSLLLFDGLENILEKSLFSITELDIEKQNDGILCRVRGEDHEIFSGNLETAAG